jgi:hypothetical protein
MENTLKTRKTFCIGLAAALAFLAAPAIAQVYSWRDPTTGERRISNFPPPWYSRGEQARGPRVVATAGNKVVDDTSLPYEQRLQLFGKPKDKADNFGPQRPSGQQQATP